MARRAPTKKTAPKTAPKKAPEAKDGVLGTIPPELRVRMKGTTEALDKSRAKMANLGFAAADLKLRLADIEAQMAHEFQNANSLNQDLAGCREEMTKLVKLDDALNYRVDLNTGMITLNEEGSQ